MKQKSITLAIALLFAAHGASAASDTSEQTLPEVKVKAEADKETATSPVQGYVAKRSATATKTDTPLNEVPQSITVITADQIRDQNATTMQEVLRYTAGARSEVYGLDNRGDWFMLRGGSEGSTLLDGLRLMPSSSGSGGPRDEPYAFERIEVLRGPASIIAGQNGPGGVVNLVSKRPQTETAREVEVQVGDRDHKRIAADLTGALNEDGTLLYRLVALEKRSNTQVDHAFDDRRLIAPSLTWKPASGTSMTAFAEYQKDNTANTNAFFGYEGTLLPAPNGPLSYQTFIGEPDWDRYTRERTRFGYRLEHELNDRWTVRHNLRHDDSDAELRSMYAAWWLGFADSTGATDPNGTYMNRIWYASNTQLKSTVADVTLEGKYQLGSTRHTLLLGVDGRNASATELFDNGAGTPLDVYHPVYGSFPEPSISSTTPSVSSARDRGLLLQDQIKINQQYVVTAGLRHDRTHVSANGSGYDASATSKNLGLVYLADGGWSPYAGYSESFESVADTDINGSPFKPKRGKQVEAGVKWSPNQQVSSTAALYHLREKNRLAPDPANPNFSTQKGEVAVKGMEVETVATLPAWDVIANYTFTHAEVTSTTPDDIASLGQQLNSIPEHSAAVWAVHKLGAYGLPGWRTGLGLRYTGKTWDGTGTTSVPAYTIADALLGYDHANWRVALNVTNLANKTYLATCLTRGDCWFGTKRRVVLTTAYRW